MAGTERKKYHLVITITALFTGLIIVFGLVFREFVYHQTSRILLADSSRFFASIASELTTHYQVNRRSSETTLKILAASGVTEAKSLEIRLKPLPLFTAAMQADPTIAALQVGYDNGDYFIVRPLTSDYLTRTFSPPANAAFMADNISTPPEGNRILERVWIDNNMKELGRDKPVLSEYDPRKRPWFLDKTQTGNINGTPPYLFHFMQQMGMTFSLRPSGASAVIGSDISLFELSKILEKYRDDSRGELILLEKRDDIFLVAAYHNPDKLISKEGETPGRATSLEMGSPVISHVSGLRNIELPLFSFEFGGEDWLGSTRKLDFPDQKNIFLVMLSPEAEIVGEARKIQQQTLYLTLLMILLAIPVTRYLAGKIAGPIRDLAGHTRRISGFAFGTRPIEPSFIKEVDELGQAISLMEDTIGRFITLINSLAGSQNFDTLLHQVTSETLEISGAESGCAFILNEEATHLVPSTILNQSHCNLTGEELLATGVGEGPLLSMLTEGQQRVVSLSRLELPVELASQLGPPEAQTLILPLQNRQDEGVGVLCLVYKTTATELGEDSKLAFLNTLSGFAAVTLESRKLLELQKQLLESFIRLLAGAIDSKSPYTGGHCQRVPELALLLASKACESNNDVFKSFDLTEDQWEALRIAAWLHDCGKVTTPEYVVDKATKLETLYDRIHEIRTRFEVLKRDAEIKCLKDIIAGGNEAELREQCAYQWRELDEEFAFIAECNLGTEFLPEEKIRRILAIGNRTWKRTLDDRIGLSWEELQRKQRQPEQPLPAEEKLLADRIDHLLDRPPVSEATAAYDFVLEIPEHGYNRGEIYNLSVQRGTLSSEERFKINDHIVQTIIMLDKLPYPRHLRRVPEIAGGHHEKLDGTGYPRGLRGEQMSMEAKIMVIADIFEALTASDRPYKKGKTLSEALTIMGYMKKDGHLDPDLFHLFIESKAWREYGEKFLRPEQIDEVDIEKFLS